MAAANQGPKRVRLTSASKLNRYKNFMRMNWRGLVGINPVLLGLLRQTTAAASFTHIVLDKLGDDGAELSMRAAQEGEEGAIALDFSASGRTAEALLSLVTAEWPGLKVAKGRLRSFAIEFRDDETPPHLVLNLKDSTVELAPKRKKSGGSEEAQDGQKSAEQVTAGGLKSQTAGVVNTTPEEGAKRPEAEAAARGEAAAAPDPVGKVPAPEGEAAPA